MKIHPRCLSCLIGQVENTYHLLKPSASNEEIVQTQKEVMQIISQLKETWPGFYGQALYRLIGKKLGTRDPFKELKHKYNQIALKMTSEVDELIHNSKDPLLTAIEIAIIGNIIDLGTAQKIDIEKEIKEFSIEKLIINHYDKFLKDFNRANKILILGDNAGEIVFDKVLIQFIQKQYPQKKVWYAVRGGPAINDATIEDAKEVGLTEICEVVEGSESPGIIWPQTSDAFQNAFKAADLIVSKGMGNFETADEVPTPHAPMYFLLKAKCELIADQFHVPIGSLVFSFQS